MKPILAILIILFSYSAAAENVFDLQGEAAQQRLQALRETIADNPKNTQALKEAGIILHQINRRNPNKESVEEGERYLKKALRNNLADAETEVWLGSITTMKAQFESDPGRQTFFVKSGSQKMDAAIRKAPDNPIVRLTRAYNSLEIPPFLKRTRFAVEDFNHYLFLCETHNCNEKDINAANSALEEAKRIIAGNS